MLRVFTFLFRRSKSKPIVRQAPAVRTRLRLEHLEDRFMPAITPFTSPVLALPVSGITYNSAAEEVSIIGSNLNDKVEWAFKFLPSGDINTPPQNLTYVTMKTFDPNVSLLSPVKEHKFLLPPSVARIRFSGYGGKDTFTNLRNIASYADGGSGNDLLQAGAGGGTFTGGTGNDTITGGFNADVIHGGTGADQLYGNGGNDTVHGDAGDDTLFGGDGDDILHGGADDDLLRGDAHNDLMRG